MSFSAAHSLRGYIGKCARLHGHNYRVKADIQTHEVNDIGIAIDYFDIKQVMRPIIDKLDHQNLNTIMPFDTVNPTAENVAQWFYHQLNKALLANPKTSNAKLTALTIWENEDFSVCYREN